MDDAIRQFFQERKEGWLKKNIKASMSEAEQQELEAESEQVFALQNWLPSAAKRAGQISIATHPCTFSHPSARKNKNGYASAVIANAQFNNDGFLRSGNVTVAADALGNAAALDVYKFLTLTLADGQTLLHHLQHETEQAKTLLTIENPNSTQQYEALREGFLAMVETGGEAMTSSKIKQVYFPITNDGTQTKYHQLSLLTASGIVFELRERLDRIRFSEQTKAARENKKNNQPGEPYREIYGLTTIGYGGTKPQNISVLNNQNGGKAHLLSAMPPVLEKRDIQFPTQDFFQQCVRYRAPEARLVFTKLHTFYQQTKNNIDARQYRDSLYQALIHYVVEQASLVRQVNEQFMNIHSQLPSAQRIWLHVSKAPDDDAWLDDILQQITDFIFHGYEQALGKEASKFADGEYQHMANMVNEHRELIR